MESKKEQHNFICAGLVAAHSAVLFVLPKPGLFPHASPSDGEDGGSMGRQYCRSGRGQNCHQGCYSVQMAHWASKVKQKKWRGVLSCLPKALVPNEMEKLSPVMSLSVAHHQYSPVIDAKDSPPISTFYSQFISLATHFQSSGTSMSTLVCKRDRKDSHLTCSSPLSESW